MRFVAIAASAAAFWLLVATMRLALTDGRHVGCACPHRPTGMSSPVVAAPPAVQVDPLPPAPAEPSHACDDVLVVKDPRRPGPISKRAVVCGMNALRPLIARCYEEFQVPGRVLVNVVIAKSGRVSDATVTGKFFGTPTGTCVERAVKAARFPPSDGLTTTYPFQLR